MSQENSWWQLTAPVESGDLPGYTHALNEAEISVSWKEEAGKLIFEAFFFCPEVHSVEEGAQHLQGILKPHGLELPEIYKVEHIQNKDWLEENYQSFPPVTIGQFFFYGSHYEGAMPPGSICIELDAAAAFGSGEHATTKGCLVAIEKMMDVRPLERVLDVGCGSGILSMVLAKLYDVSIVASDIDVTSVAVTQENITKNGVADTIDVRLGNGYDVLTPGETFHLIVSNILAHPLIQMADQLTAALEPGGHGIISGFLEEQADEVIAAHEAQGLELVEAIPYDGWVAAILKKP